MIKGAFNPERHTIKLASSQMVSQDEVGNVLLSHPSKRQRPHLWKRGPWVPQASTSISKRHCQQSQTRCSNPISFSQVFTLFAMTWTFLLETILEAVPSRVGRVQSPSLWRGRIQCNTHYGPCLQRFYLNIPPPLLKVGKDQKSTIKYRVITSYCESTPNTVIAHAGSLTQVTLLLPGANNAHAITINSWWTVTCLCIWNGGCFWKSYHVQTYILGHLNYFFNPPLQCPLVFFSVLGSGSKVLWPVLFPWGLTLREKPRSSTRWHSRCALPSLCCISQAAQNSTFWKSCVNEGHTSESKRWNSKIVKF